MKNLLIVLLLVGLTSCKGCYTSFAEQKASVLRICPKCTFVRSEANYFAVDTSKQPNIIYKVNFKMGGYWYTASDVEDFVRVN